MTAVYWGPICTHSAGCTGIQSAPGTPSAPGTLCLAHLADADLKSALSALTPGSDLDASGVTFTDGLLSAVLAAFTAPDASGPTFGNATFAEAQFTGNASFAKAHFTGNAWFGGAQFIGAAVFYKASFAGAQFARDAVFSGARFTGDARFDGAQFGREASFEGTQFVGDAFFNEAQFAGDAWFIGTEFTCDAWFEQARFTREAWFSVAEVSRNAYFGEARFEAAWGGPFRCAGVVSAVSATVSRPVRLQILARELRLKGARFESTAVLLLRYAAVDMTGVVAAAPITVVSHPEPFTNGTNRLGESSFSGNPRASISTLAGVDAANLVLTDMDLSECVFSGAYHLDQIRFEGRCTFAEVPHGWHVGRALIPVRRWSPRKVLAEEHHWRASMPGRSPLVRQGWKPAPDDADVHPTAATLVAVYRQLRKALEDGKDEPGASDFYYGEMEARRHDRHTPLGERALLHGYWLVSGYALRTTRALGFLLAAMTLTLLAMMAFGLPDASPNQQITGTLPAPGGRATLTMTTPDAHLTLPASQRFTASRAESASLVVVNSVIFRSSGQNLTTAGTWIEMASRISEPVLLGFAALAARGRVKR